MMKNGYARKRFWGRGTTMVLMTLSLALVGCGGGPEHGHDGDHEGHGHAHHAPHGGSLGMLGDHAFQIEILPQPAEGRIDLYVLDGEAERFVRIASPVLEARVKAGRREWVLRFQAVGNEATGEVVGSSSHFSVKAEELVEMGEFELSFDRLELLGQVFEDVRIPHPDGSHGD